MFTFLLPVAAFLLAIYITAWYYFLFGTTTFRRGAVVLSAAPRLNPPPPAAGAALGAPPKPPIPIALPAPPRGPPMAFRLLELPPNAPVAAPKPALGAALKPPIAPCCCPPAAPAPYRLPEEPEFGILKGPAAGAPPKGAPAGAPKPLECCGPPKGLPATGAGAPVPNGEAPKAGDVPDPAARLLLLPNENPEPPKLGAGAAAGAPAVDPNALEKGFAAGAAVPKDGVDPKGPAAAGALTAGNAEEENGLPVPVGAVDPISIPGEAVFILPLPKDIVVAAAGGKVVLVRESTAATPKALVLEAPPMELDGDARGGLPAVKVVANAGREVPDVDLAGANPVRAVPVVVGVVVAPNWKAGSAGRPVLLATAGVVLVLGAAGVVAPNMKGLVSVLAGVAVVAEAPPNINGFGSVDTAAGAAAVLDAPKVKEVLGSSAFLSEPALAVLPNVKGLGASGLLSAVLGAAPKVIAAGASTFFSSLLAAIEAPKVKPPSDALVAEEAVTGAVAPNPPNDTAGLGLSPLLFPRSTPAGNAGNPPKEGAVDAAGAALLPLLLANPLNPPKAGAAAGVEDSPPPKPPARFLAEGWSSDSSRPEVTLSTSALRFTVEVSEVLVVVLAGFVPKEGVEKAGSEVAAGVAAAGLLASLGVSVEGLVVPKENPPKGLLVAGAALGVVVAAVVVEAAPKVNPPTAGVAAAAGFSVVAAAPGNVKPPADGFASVAGAELTVPKPPNVGALPLAGVVAVLAPKVKPPFPMVPGASAALAGAPNALTVLVTVEAGAAVLGADFKGASQEAHLVAPSLLRTIQASHLIPLLILAAAHIPIPEEAGAEVALGASFLVTVVVAVRGDSQEAHLTASFLLRTMHTLHLTPSLILLAAQILTEGAVSILFSVLLTAGVALPVLVVVAAAVLVVEALILEVSVDFLDLLGGVNMYFTL